MVRRTTFSLEQQRTNGGNDDAPTVAGGTWIGPSGATCVWQGNDLPSSTRHRSKRFTAPVLRSPDISRGCSDIPLTVTHPYHRVAGAVRHYCGVRSGRGQRPTIGLDPVRRTGCFC
jgi:hypothetical protein